MARERQDDPQHARGAGSRSPAAAPPRVPESIGELQRTFSNRQLARLVGEGRVLARDGAGATAAPAAPAVPGPWGIDLTTAEALAAYYRLGAASMEDDIKGLKPGENLDERVRLWVEEVRALSDALAEGKTRPLTKADVERWNTMADDAMPLREEIQTLRATRQWEANAPARKKAYEAAEEAKRVAEEAQRMAPKIDDGARMAFKSGDEGMLTSLADITGNITDIGLGIHELSREIAQKAATMTSTQLPAVSKYTETLNKFNKGLAALNLALSLTGDKAKTEFDEGLRWVGISAGAFSSLGTVVGLPAHMGLYANLYLVPLTKACIAGCQRIAEYKHQENKSWVELTGEPGNFFVEPGGKPMWQYMAKVMRASKTADIPAPPSDVAKYFMEHRDAFQAGVKGQAAIPTKGLVFKDLDVNEFRSWLFGRRRQVWAMLYGSMKVPN